MKKPFTEQGGHRPELGSLGIALLYLLVGGLWILVSDTLTDNLVGYDQERLTQVSIYKGLGYVLVTGILLYLLMRANTRSLRKANENYLLLANNISDVIWVIDLDAARFTYISPSIQALRGLTPEEALRETPQQALLPESWEYISRALPARIEEFKKGANNVHVDELAQPHKDGSTVWVEVSSRFVVNARNGHIEVYAASRGIGDRKQVEERLKKSEKRFRSAFDTMLEGCQILGFDWRYLYLNKSAEKHNRRSNEELMGNVYMDMWPGIETTPVFAMLKDCMEGRSASHLENRFVYPDGQVGWFDLSIQPVPEGVFILSVDVTERIQAEQALRESRLILDAAEEVAAIGSWSWDFSTQKVIWSDEMFHLFGVQREGFDGDLNRVIAERIHPDDIPAVQESNRQVLEYAHPVPLSYRICLPDGTERVVWSQGKIIEDENGRPTALTGYVQDITERVCAEKQTLQMKRLYATLSQVNQTIMRVRRREELFQTICDVAVRFGEYALAWVGLLDGMTGEVRPAAAVGLELSDWPFPSINVHRTQDEGLIVAALRSLRVVTSEDIQTDARLQAMHAQFMQYGFHSSAAVPLQEGDRPVGVLVLVSREAGFFKAKEEVQLLEEMGLDISFALETMENEKIKRQWADAFENCAHGIAIGLPASGRILTCNPAFALMQGRTTEEISSMLILEMYAPEDREHVQNSIAEADRTGRVQYQAHMVRADGRTYPVQMDVVSVRDEAGNLLYRVATQQDISARKRSEQVLRESEVRFSKIFQASSIGINIFNLDDGRSLDANNAFLEIVGYSRPEVIGHSAEELNLFVDSEARAAWMENLREGRSIHNQDARIRRKSGEIRDALASLDVIEINGEPMALVITADITERKQIEVALRRTEEKYRNIFENAAEAITQTTPDGRYITANPATARILGYASPAELIDDITDLGRQFYVQPGRRDEFTRLMREHGSVTGFESEIYRRDGRRIWVSENSRAVHDDQGNLLWYEGTSQDITERKKAEEEVKLQLRRMSALTEIERAIASSLDMRLSLDILLSEVLMQLGVDAACVLLLNSTSQVLEYMAGKGFRTTGIRQSYMRLGEGLAGQVGLERRVLHVPDLPSMGAQFKRNGLLGQEGFLEYFGIPLIAKGALKGVLEIFHRGPLDPNQDWVNYLETLGGQAAIAIDNAQMFEDIQRSNLELVTAYDATIAGWSHALDLRDKETEGHTQRVTDLTVRLAQRMGLGEQELIHIRRGALLHDIGKLGVPDGILLKPGPLTDEEWYIMRQHPVYAFDMLTPISYLRPALDIPFCHHEKWDGSGYPRGLKGEQIPLAARIFAVVDVWDALCSDRPYRARWSREKTRAHILEQSGAHFDPRIVTAFLGLVGSE